MCPVGLVCRDVLFPHIRRILLCVYMYLLYILGVSQMDNNRQMFLHLRTNLDLHRSLALPLAAGASLGRPFSSGSETRHLFCVRIEDGLVTDVEVMSCTSLRTSSLVVATIPCRKRAWSSDTPAPYTHVINRTCEILKPGSGIADTLLIPIMYSAKPIDCSSSSSVSCAPRDARVETRCESRHTPAASALVAHQSHERVNLLLEAVLAKSSVENLHALVNVDGS